MPKPSKNYNGIIITLLTILYILFIVKLADVITSYYDDEDIRLERYVMIVYILSIMGLVIGYIWLDDVYNGNIVIRKSLSYGGIILLIYIITNYWNYLDDYAKLIMLAFTIVIIVYYVYK